MTSSALSEDRPRFGLAAMCASQTIAWGLLYYSLPVALTAIEASTGWSSTLILGSFTAGLVVSALLGPSVGRRLDARGPRGIMSLGAVVGAVSLALVAWSPHALVFAAGWTLAGFAQAATFYTTAFAVLTRWYGPQRVRPMMILTLAAGFSSTIFAPLTVVLVEGLGWRTAYAVMAVMMALTVLPLNALFLNRRWSQPADADVERSDDDDGLERADSAAEQAIGERVRRISRSPRFLRLQLALTMEITAVTAFTLTMIPLVVERGLSAHVGAAAMAVVGVGQVAARLGYGGLAARTSPQGRAVIVIGLCALAAWALALMPGSAPGIIAAAALFGAGRGLRTLIQATAVSDRWGTEGFGELHGRFSAPITAMMALAPALAAVCAELLGGYAAMAMLMAAVLTAAAWLARRT